MEGWHKKQGESPLAGGQNSAGYSSSVPAFELTAVMDTSTALFPSATASDPIYPPSTKDPRLAQQTSNSFTNSLTQSLWSSTPTWVTSTRSPHNHYSAETFEITLSPPPSEWDPSNTSQSHSSVHPGVIVVPIIVFAVILGLLYSCLRSRKRRIQAITAQRNAQEMAVRQPRSIYPYNAPQLETSSQFSTSRSQPSLTTLPTLPPPVILGPILTGADSSYLTGIDTSEEASMGLDGPLPDPFDDSQVAHTNDDVAEPPPPPYRPRSVALPSFAAASQTHLVERSPFDDPHDDDDNADAVSELSEPIGEGDDDAMSAVSDLSDRHDADIGRTSV